MTAEVAVLNRLAVALAADSTVTVSTKHEQHKTFETADKLFELSRTQPIGVMFFGNGHFMDMPISVLVKEFRSALDPLKPFSNLVEAKDEFLEFLLQFGGKAPADLQAENTVRHLLPDLNMIMSSIQMKAEAAFQRALEGGSFSADGIREERDAILKSEFEVIINILSGYDDAAFVGPPADDRLGDKVEDMLIENLDWQSFTKTDDRVELIISVAELLAKRYVAFGNPSGLVFAGFGKDEICPTLVSCELSGFVQGRVKYKDVEYCDISRSYPSAAVFGFAQRDVLDRFLYGYDEDTRSHIVKTAKFGMEGYLSEAVEALRDAGVPENILDELITRNQNGVEKFETILGSDGFDFVTAQGRKEIEDLVRFMPKPDMAEMAESLVNLTSMKRRVSKGMETVGGPVDVAIISKSEGFIWVKRKHYFDASLNHGFFNRRELGKI